MKKLFLVLILLVNSYLGISQARVGFTYQQIVDELIARKMDYTASTTVETSFKGNKIIYLFKGTLCTKTMIVTSTKKEYIELTQRYDSLYRKLSPTQWIKDESSLLIVGDGKKQITFTEKYPP